MDLAEVIAKRLKVIGDKIQKEKIVDHELAQGRNGRQAGHSNWWQDPMEYLRQAIACLESEGKRDKNSITERTRQLADVIKEIADQYDDRWIKEGYQRQLFGKMKQQVCMWTGYIAK